MLRSLVNESGEWGQRRYEYINRLVRYGVLERDGDTVVVVVYVRLRYAMET